MLFIYMQKFSLYNSLFFCFLQFLVYVFNNE